MRLQKAWYRPVFLIFILCMISTGATAWTVQSLIIKPASGPVSPGTAVAVTYTVHFDTGTSGEEKTFDSDHTLDMLTELNDAEWTVTLVNIDEDRAPITTRLGSKAGVRYRIDGWTLSYNDAELDLIVTLRGIAPGVAAAQEKTIIRVGELDSEAAEVPGALKVVRYQVAFQTTAATARTPAPASLATEIPRAPGITEPAATPAPTIKQTYSPGPDPVLVILLLILVGIVGQRIGTRRSP